MKKIKKSVTVFDDILGKKVSVLIDHFKPFGKLKESYVGIPFERKDGFLKVYLNGKKIDAIFIREDQIISIWMYKD